MAPNTTQISLLKNEERNDVTKWSQPGSAVKLEFTDVCNKIYNLDITTNPKYKFFFNMNHKNKIIITEELLDWCQYEGTYKEKKHSFLKMIKKYNIPYEEIQDEAIPQKTYISLATLDFESLLMRMTGTTADELRLFYSFSKHVFIKYQEYEKYFSHNQNALLIEANKDAVRRHEEQMLLLKEEIKKSEQVRIFLKEEFQKSEQDRILNEERAQLFKLECVRAELARERADERARQEEEQRIKTEQEFQRAQKRHIEIKEELHASKRRQLDIQSSLENKTVPDIIELAPRITPKPINKSKQHCLLLVELEEKKAWYIIRRQHQSVNKGLLLFEEKYGMVPNIIQRWDDISHAINVGNILKLHLRNLKWDARGNVLRIKEESAERYTNEELVEEIEKILADNPAIRIIRDIHNL